MFRFRFFCSVWLLFLISGTMLGSKRPNFLWLLSEDNSKHFLKLFDSTGVETPNIARLAQHGLIFEHAYSNSPVCSVARTTLITGCYAPRIGTQFHRRSVMVPLPEGLMMFPAYLRDAGYYTTNKRKQDYNALGAKEAWDESSNQATWRNRKSGQPFFHMQSFVTTHESSLHFNRRSMESQPTKTDPETVFISPKHPRTQTFKYTYARYHDQIQTVDSQIGKVVDQLTQDGLLDDTFVFYFGDHGGVLPGSKGYAYETGLHIPLVIRIPKNFQQLVTPKVGSRLNGFVSFIDFGPTVLHLAGIRIPDQVDGQAFLGPDMPVGQIESRDEAFGYADRFDEKYDLVRTLRKGKYKYIRNYQPFNFDGLQNNYRYRMLAYQEWRELFHAGSLNEVQSQFFLRRTAEALYDLEKDPYETQNLATDEKYQRVLQKLRNLLTEHVKRTNDLSFYPEYLLVEEEFSNPTKYGSEQKKEIDRLVDVANLSLIEFSKAKDRLQEALNADNPGERYWALIACSSHGDAALPLVNQIKKMAAKDVGMVRLRAAEFLGLQGIQDPSEIVLESLSQAQSEVEANLILNTLVLLRDGKHRYQFDMHDRRIQKVSHMKGLVKRRLDYLTGQLQ